MADSKISALPASTVPLAGTEVLPIVQSSTTKQVSVANLTAGRSVDATNFIPSGSVAPTNGLYLPAANSLGLSTNSALAVTITSAGDVGVGTNSPTTFSGFKALELANSSGSAISLVTGTSVIAQTISSSTNSLVYMGARSNHSLVFTTNDTERARLNTTGAFVLAGGTTTANGIGITFPASQSASSDANTLDDYEEGTWTPSQGAGLTVVGTFSSSGTYTKIGRVVNLRGSVSGSTTVALAASDTVICGNIPFTPIGSVADRNIGGMTNNTNNASGAVSALGSFTTIYNIGTIAATTDIHFSVTYFA